MINWLKIWWKQQESESDKEYHVMCLNCGARNGIKFKEIAIINWNLRMGDNNEH